jgi:ATP-dependent Clp protease protease subunit
MSKRWFHIDNASEVPTISIIGYIGDGEDGVDYASFRSAFDQATKSKKAAFIVINSGGGSMTEGFAIYDHIRESGVKCKCKVIGMAASMASIIALSCDTISMSKNASFMVHRPKAGAYGESQALRSMADFADKLELKAKAIYKERTGLADDVINSWMLPGVDKWMTSSEALANKLIDDITQDQTLKIAASVKSMSEREAWQVYNSVTENFHSNPSNMKQFQMSVALLVMLALTSDASDAAIEQRITEMANENARLKTENATLADQVKVANEAKVKQLIDDSISQKKISEGEREAYAQLAAKDYDNTKKALDARAPVGKVTDAIIPGTGKPELSAERAGWTIRDWEKKDSKGLLKLKASDPDAYKALFEAAYGEVVVAAEQK